MARIEKTTGTQWPARSLTPRCVIFNSVGISTNSTQSSIGARPFFATSRGATTVAVAMFVCPRSLLTFDVSERKINKFRPQSLSTQIHHFLFALFPLYIKSNRTELLETNTFKMSMHVVKRDGRTESVHFDKITSRISKLAFGLNTKVRNSLGGHT